MIFTDECRQHFLKLLAEDHTRGNVHTLIEAMHEHGQTIGRGEARKLLDEDLVQEAREARGWNLNRVEGVRWEVALNPDHNQWDKASYSILRAYHPAFKDASKLELTGADGGPVTIEDRSASLNDVQRVLTAAGALDSSPDDPDPVAAAGEPVAAPGVV